MSSIKIGVIGGSGVYKIEGVEVVKEHTVSTPFGSPSSEIIEAKLNNSSFNFQAKATAGKYPTLLSLLNLELASLRKDAVSKYLLASVKLIRLK